MKAAMVGAPQSGKTTAFAGVTGAAKAAVDGGFARASITVDDWRLEWLAGLFKPNRIVPARLEVLDPVRPFQGRSSAGQLPAAFLNVLKPMDALILVVGAFLGQTDVKQEVGGVLEDFILADLSTVDSRLERIALDLRKGRKEVNPEEAQPLEKARHLLDSGRLVAQDEELARARVLRGYGLLTAKPLLILVNMAETASVSEGDKAGHMLSTPYGDMTAVWWPCKTEVDILAIQDEFERAEFRRELDLELPLRTVVAGLLAKILDLVCFFTVDSDEVRAWPVPRGTTAVKAAGVIHSDMEKGFIRAEVVSFAHLQEHGSEANARAAGAYRLEGRDYEVSDGDIVHFRFVD